MSEDLLQNCNVTQNFQMVITGNTQTTCYSVCPGIAKDKYKIDMVYQLYSVSFQ